MQTLLDITGYHQIDPSRVPDLAQAEKVCLATGLDQAYSQLSTEYWAKIDGVAVCWGDPQLPQVIGHIKHAVFDQDEGSPGDDAYSALDRAEWRTHEIIIRVVMPNGQVCDTKIMSDPDRVNKTTTETHVTLGWDTAPRSIEQTEMTKFFFALQGLMLEVQAVGRASSVPA